MTAAARALNYAQPSISHHLARLEAETGARLLERAGRGVRLTDAGRLLAERAEEIIGRLDAAENELAAHVGLREGRVRLASFPSALGTIVPAAAARLEAESPGMDLMLAEAEPPEALRMLRAGYVDVALVFRHYQEGADEPPGTDEEGARGRLLLDEPVNLVTRPPDRPGVAGRPGGRESAAGTFRETGPVRSTRSRSAPRSPTTANGATADLAAYAKRRWIAGCERCRSTWCGSATRPGSHPKIAFTTDDYVAVQALVAAGLGVTTLPGLCLRAARHPGRPRCRCPAPGGTCSR